MAWIEYHTALRDHWKIQRLADAQKIAYPHALGLVSCLWLWAVEYAPKGDLSKFNDAELCRASRSTSVFEIKKTLIECELLDAEFKINDWSKHGLKYLTSSKLRVRKHRYMKRYSNGTQPLPVTPTLPYPTLPYLTQPKDKDIGANGSAAIPKSATPKEPKNKTALQQIVEGWKILNNVAKDDKAWDKVHYAMNAKFASELLGLFSGSVPDALDCMESVFDRLKGKGLDLSLKGVVKNSDVYRQMWLERKAKKAVA